MHALRLIGRALQTSPTRIVVPYFGLIHCGFPSPAEDYVLAELSLDELIILNPPATFMLRAAGNSMRDVNINAGDIVIVDKSRSAKHNNIVIAVYQGDFVCKRLVIDRHNNRIILQAENPDYPSIVVEDRDQLEIWGVVTWTAHCHLDTP
ncbi:hypothetical protein BLL42_26900 (plasmid) [Pseudomonas frederiksbergensis]|uniref:Peptidase S24/S26A/S26B/S26C domain-containing protein n=1 Tax=Pseudomonas frederiksbergensis TaxID=104087 RepID=A0A1J0ET77_9PSED|nr:translesion error-prone DNA polymerase V autoproteolytic subunit [Pseudomonas frederiksbergensis]APC19373.1 hypothetical protein BLL42_26900 [Pseudomonas frederiksbergensis]